MFRMASRAIPGVYGLYVTSNAYSMFKVDNGITTHMRAGGRLHAFSVTGNGSPNTWAQPVHVDIGLLYLGFGEFGAESIGNVFASKHMRALLARSTTDSEASRTLARLEHIYWKRCKCDNPLSLGGQIGSFVNPATRNAIQQCTAQVIGCDVGK